MMFTMDRFFIVTADTTSSSPIFGKVDDEDLENGVYLIATYSLPQNYEGHQLFTITDLKDYKIFKGKEEAQEWVAANFP